MNKKIWIWLWAGIGLILCVIIFWPVDRGLEEAILDAEEVEEVVDSTEAQQEHYKYGIPADNFEIEEGTVARGQNLSMILDKYGVSSKKIHEISQRSKDVFDLRKIRSGQNYTLFLAKDSLRTPEFFIYESNKVEYVVVDFKDTTNVYLGAKDIVKRDSAVKVGISSSLWNAFSDAGVDPNLAIVLSEIYAWTIDFYGIAKGDSVRVLYEQSYVEDKPLADYTIKGAIFTNGGTSFYAIPFEQNEKISYFDQEGNSLQKAFLKAPLRYSRISSGFSNNRYHPVLKRYRAHHGVDYAAPTGTPVHSVGDGIYMHLSKFAKGIKPGKRVKQGETIGYVGATGLATGPHLDYRVYKNGTPINPLKMVSPSKEPVSPSNMPRFQQVRDSLISCLMQL